MGPSATPGRMLENMRSALSRGLPEVRRCRPHSHLLSVCGGGPSLADTFRDAKGYIAAINGSQRFLTENGILPDACGILDPGRHMPDVITADRRVRYFVASICDPGVFDKLKDCMVHLWHPSGVCGSEAALELRGGDWLQVAGGCTMGLRWINLGYVLGFRTFHLHGMDSSFRDGETHAYPDRERDGAILTINGRKTRANFWEQVGDFMATLQAFKQPDIEPVTFEVFGDGLLQDVYRACA